MRGDPGVFPVFPLGSMKDHRCVHGLMSYASCTHGRSTHVRKTAVIVKELSPNFPFLVSFEFGSASISEGRKLLSMSGGLANSGAPSRCASRAELPSGQGALTLTQRGLPSSTPQQKAPAGGWLTRHPASPNCQLQRVGYNTLSVLLNGSQHACPQNVQATAPGDPCSPLEPCPALHIKIPGSTQSNEQGWSTSGVEWDTWPAPLAQT